MDRRDIAKEDKFKQCKKDKITLRKKILSDFLLECIDGLNNYYIALLHAANNISPSFKLKVNFNLYDIHHALTKTQIINHTQFLLLNQAILVQAVKQFISELRINIEAKTRYSPEFKDLKHIPAIIEFLTIFKPCASALEDMAVINPAAFESFKIINHYLVSTLSQKIYTSGSYFLDLAHKIQGVIKYIIEINTKSAMMASHHKKQSYFFSVLHDLINTIANTIFDYDRTRLQPKSSPAAKRALESVILFLEDKTQKISPQLFSKYICDDVIPSKITINYDSDNKKKLMLHALALLEYEIEIGVVVSVEIFEGYLNLCFPGPADKQNLEQAKLELAQYISRQRAFIVDSAVAYDKLDKRIGNIKYVGDKIFSHKMEVGILDEITLTYEGFLQLLKKEVDLMRLDGKNSENFEKALEAIYILLPKIYDADTQEGKIELIIELINALAKEITIELGNPTHGHIKFVQEVIKMIDLEKSSIIAAGNYGKLIKILQILHIIINKTKDESCTLTHLPWWRAAKLASIFAMNYQINEQDKSHWDQIYSYLIYRVFDDEDIMVAEFSDKDSVPIITTEQLIYLKSALQNQNDELVKQLDDINDSLLSSLMKSVDLNGIIVEEDGQIIAAKQFTSFGNDIYIADFSSNTQPAPYSLSDQLKLHQELQAKIIKLEPVIARKPEHRFKQFKLSKQQEYKKTPQLHLVQTELIETAERTITVEYFSTDVIGAYNRISENIDCLSQNRDTLLKNIFRENLRFFQDELEIIYSNELGSGQVINDLDQTEEKKRYDLFNILLKWPVESVSISNDLKEILSLACQLRLDSEICLKLEQINQYLLLGYINDDTINTQVKEISLKNAEFKLLAFNAIIKITDFIFKLFYYSYFYFVKLIVFLGKPIVFLARSLFSLIENFIVNSRLKKINYKSFINNIDVLLENFHGNQEFSRKLFAIKMRVGKFGTQNKLLFLDREIKALELKYEEISKEQIIPDINTIAIEPLKKELDEKIRRSVLLPDMLPDSKLYEEDFIQALEGKTSTYIDKIKSDKYQIFSDKFQEVKSALDLLKAKITMPKYKKHTRFNVELKKIQTIERNLQVIKRGYTLEKSENDYRLDIKSYMEELRKLKGLIDKIDFILEPKLCDISLPAESVRTLKKATVQSVQGFVGWLRNSVTTCGGYFGAQKEPVRLKS